MRKRRIAAVAADLRHRDLHLRREGQREEGMRLSEGRIHQGARHAVIDEIEEADGAAGARDLLAAALEAGVLEIMHVDDGNRVHLTHPSARR